MKKIFTVIVIIFVSLFFSCVTTSESSRKATAEQILITNEDGYFVIHNLDSNGKKIFTGNIYIEDRTNNMDNPSFSNIYNTTLFVYGKNEISQNISFLLRKDIDLGKYRPSESSFDILFNTDSKYSKILSQPLSPINSLENYENIVVLTYQGKILDFDFINKNGDLCIFIKKMDLYKNSPKVINLLNDNFIYNSNYEQYEEDVKSLDNPFITADNRLVLQVRKNMQEHIIQSNLFILSRDLIDSNSN